MTNKFKQVTKEEFEEFLKNYPKKLEGGTITVGDPTIFISNDFTLGNYPDSIVAKLVDDYGYDWETKERISKPEYWILNGGIYQEQQA